MLESLRSSGGLTFLIRWRQGLDIGALREML